MLGPVQGHAEVVKVLLEEGQADPTVISHHGHMSARHVAEIWGHEDCLNVLKVSRRRRGGIAGIWRRCGG